MPSVISLKSLSKRTRGGCEMMKLWRLVCGWATCVVIVFGIYRLCKKAINETQKRRAKGIRETHSGEDFHRNLETKLETIEEKIDSSNRIQKFGILYPMGAAFVILGLTYWPGLMDALGLNTADFYVRTPIALIALGSATMIFAFLMQRNKK